MISDFTVTYSAEYTLDIVNLAIKQAEANGYQKTIEMLRSKEAMIEYENTGLGSMSKPTAWADWLESRNPYVSKKK